MQLVAIMSRQPVYNLSDIISVTVILLIIMHVISIVIVLLYLTQIALLYESSLFVSMGSQLAHWLGHLPYCISSLTIFYLIFTIL